MPVAEPTILANSTIETRLLSSFENFFAFHDLDDDTSFISFASQLELLYDDTIETNNRGDLDTETANLAFGVADTIETICQTLIDLEVADNNRANQLKNDLTVVVAQHKSSTVTEASSSRSQSSSTYIEPAYRWLVDNLHNPYPSREVRHKLSRDTNTPNKDIDNWFTNARRRIGWNTLLQSFDGDRDRLIEAAAGYYFGEYEYQHGPIAVAFADIESTLLDLYSGKFEQSTLGKKLGGVVKNMTPELQAQEQANKKKRKEQREAEKRAKKARVEKTREVDARGAYPSPESSPSRTVDSSLPSEAAPSRKRRSSDDDEDSDSDAHRSKRLRTDDVDHAVVTLPSPTATDTGSTRPSRDPTPAPSSSKRKRHVSDSDGAGTFKRHRGIYGSYRSVSDPSSSTSKKTKCRPVELYVPPNLEGWFTTAPAEFPEDPEVDVFNYAAMSPSSQYSDETESSAGPSTPRSATLTESSSADGGAPSVTLLNDGSILDSIYTPEFSVSGLNFEGLMPTAVPTDKQSDPALFLDLDAFLESSFTETNLFNASTDFGDIDFTSSSSSSTWKLADDWLIS